MYYKQIKNGYIVAVGIGRHNVEITEAEYNNIMQIVDNRPVPPEGYGYRLTPGLTWELYELPAPPDETGAPELTAEEALDIILGGDGT